MHQLGRVAGILESSLQREGSVGVGRDAHSALPQPRHGVSATAENRGYGPQYLQLQEAAR